MTTTTVETTTETAPKHHGGAAPDHRRCRRILGNGDRCGRWAVRGQGLCVQHGAWEMTDVRGPVALPLLEDEASIRLTISQAARAMANGTLPPANARTILAGCREARMLLHEERWAKWLEWRMRGGKAMDASEERKSEPQDVVSHRGQWLAPADAEPEAAAAQPSASDGAAAGTAPDADGTDAASGGEAILCAQGEEPLQFGDWTDTSRDRAPAPWDDANDPPAPDPMTQPVRLPRFRHLKTNWDIAMARFESDMLDLRLGKGNKTDEEYREMMARPYEAYFGNRPG